ncbi:MAG: glycosyltransferase family 4 protein, partial [Muribaculaceae bacterium]|nr:glycosyltransferase family 4 protein [Muribaculaceae bacterium]
MRITEYHPKKKILRIATISDALYQLLPGQLRYLNHYYEVVGVANDTGSFEQLEAREGIRTIHVPMVRQISLWQDLKSLYALYRVFKQEKPDIVHANTPKASLLSMVAAWLARVPHRIYLVTGLRFETTKGLFRWVLKTMERITCWCATKVIPEGEGVKQTLLRETITTKPMQIIHYGNINGIDLDYFVRSQSVLAAAEPYMDKERFTFVFIGRIVGDKGVNELVAAFEQLLKQNPHVRLLLVGSFEEQLDPIAPETMKAIRTNSSIQHVGFQQDVRPFLAASDVLVLPSYREGFPNVVIQAGAMDLPCVVTDINGCNETIIHQKNG